MARKREMKAIPNPHLIISIFRMDGKNIININMIVKIRKITEVVIYGFLGLFLLLICII